MRVALGGFAMTIGWLLLGFGLLVSLIFVVPSELMTAGRFDGPLRVTDGKVLRQEWTSTVVDGAFVVAAVHFEYSPADAPLQGTSYTRGEVPPVGSTVVVEYSAGDARVARIRDMSSARFPRTVAFLLVVPGTGLLFLLWGFWRGIRNTHLLAHGRLAEGQLLQQAESNAVVLNKRVYRLTFVFFDDQKRRWWIKAPLIRKHRRTRFADLTTEQVLYDPASGAAVLLDDIPGNTSVGRDGNFAGAGLFGMLRVLVMPAAAGVMTWAGTLFPV
ncbi:MAG TPA: hypothetical protein VF384_07820 [Planctomycetota bacterium]